MSTLDTHGMVSRYKVNRPLNEHELEHQLKIKKKQSDYPHYELSLIRFNSCFAESVDKWYAMRGFVSFGSSVGATVVALMLSLTIYVAIAKSYPLAFLPAIIGVPVLVASIYLMKCEYFTYTHYPIRFNRKNRQVYVFQRDGSILKAPWDDIYWTIFGHGVGFGDIYVMGHVMSDDRKIVKQSFALSLTSAGKQGVERLKGHFEFYRRYMEQGPENVLKALGDQPLIMLPALHKHREGWLFGWERISLHMNGWPLLMLLYQVFAFPESFFRWIAMRTSKIPQWPQWVEDECQIDADDPWVREGK